MGLLPLEFTDGLTDSPFFRETLQAHERELDLTNTAIKHLIKDIKDLIAAARNLSRAQRTLSDTLNNFNFECIGNSQTDDEMIIANSFKDFARLLSTIEDERDRLLEKADEAFLEPIERFRRDQIGSAKEAKKKFEKETAKYCQNLERYLNLSVKKSETQLWEADANNSMEQQHFFKAMSEYVLKLQEVNERKKFEFVETVLSFMLGWLTFYHQGHEIATDFYSVKMELQMRLQRTRNNFNMTQEETKSLRKKMLDNQEKFRQKFQDSCSLQKTFTRQGYLFLMEKKAFTTSWTKHFCKYNKQNKHLKLIQYTQTTGKIISTDEIIVKECIKRNQDTIDRRFCFDIVAQTDLSSNSNHHSGHSITTNGSNNNNGISNNNAVGQKHSINLINSSSTTTTTTNDLSSQQFVIYTFQSISEEDYKYWLETLNARDPYPVNINNQKSNKQNTNKSNNNDNMKNNINIIDNHTNETYQLDINGYWFIKKCIKTIELHGLDQKGIYRMVGVASRVRTLMDMFIKSKQSNENITEQNTNDNDDVDDDNIDLLPNFNIDSDEFETKTLTSALKNYLRNINEPIMTFKLHNSFITAAKLENRALRIEKIHQLVHRLPPINFKVLKILIEHLQKVAKLHDKNLMTSSNLGVCFGPTLLRTAEESVAAIMDIKFVNVIAELLIENYEKLFLTKPIQISEQEQIPTINYFPSTMNTNCYLSNSQIQQRPLPNVPISQQQQQQQYQHYAKTIYETPLLNNNNNNNNRLLPPSLNQQSTDICRSNSQDQLHMANIQSKSRLMYTNNNLFGQNMNGLNIQQHLKQFSGINYSTYPNFQFQQQQQQTNCINNNTSVSRRALHLSLSSSSSPSPSLGSTTTFSTIANNNNNNNTLQQQQYYYSQSHQQQQQQQKSLLTGGGGGGGEKKNPTGLNSNLIYNRPMTSIGIMAPNSNYTNLLRSDNNNETKLESSSTTKNNFSPIINESLSMQSGLISLQNAQSLQQQQQHHSSRPVNFSSSSSTSLPSTPEHSQFSFKLPPATTTTIIKSTTTTLTTSSAMAMNRNPIIVDQTGSTLTDPINELYGSTNSSSGVNHSHHHQQQQQQPNKSIYASISNQQPTSSSLSSSQQQQQQQQQSSIIGRTVRTRYVCIGGTDCELSFQPNMIITNVRPSREPGWLEGTLNGKTGLIPLNYVEYID
ncbi:Rho GTPase-activating protein 42 [Dermatophagoides pteronyssinus]|uniref:Rho GTPase-activating protein 42 n=1 Tax=Dermatophagoides pteronyssinus TaxID=6956 RepID=A0ABQ8JG85_DERPT|nr:Rho GTPase-activating protein 42 [Dermatophagoides pteronyssinus]